MEDMERKETIEKEEPKEVRKGRNVVFTVFACIMTGIIVFLSSSLGQKIYNSYNPNHGSSINKKQADKCDISVNDNDLFKIYNILGVSTLEHPYLGLNVILSEMNKETSNLTLDEKKSIIFWYAFENRLFDEILLPTTGEKYDGISIENFDIVKEYYGITEDYTMFFESNMIYNGYLLYSQGGTGTASIVKHNFSSKIVDNNIIVTDNAVISQMEDEKSQTIEFKFSKNNKDEYYLVSSTKLQ